MMSRQIYCCPVHPEMRKLGPGVCPKCDASLLAEGSSYAVALRIVQDPLMLLNLVGWATLAMSIVALFVMRG
ncbi:MAG TPA: hypothetical protein VJO54_16180 [Burkholderiales bacterium]|nr:hypothetical protein [Burkholderiales bacterium]